MIEKNLYKDRSYSSCIHSAYELMFTNFATIFRKTWLAALVYSAVVCLSVLFNSFSWMQLLLAVPVIFGLSWLGASVVSMLNDKPFKHNYIYCLQAVLSLAIIVILFSVIIIMCGTVILLSLGNKLPEHFNSLYLASLAFITLLFIIAAIPLSYSIMKYLVESNDRIWSVLGKAYRKGWRYWGFITLVFILCIIIIAVLYVVIGSPRLVIYLANQNNTYGLTFGDPNGLPKYFDTLDYIVSTIITFLSCYINLWVFFVLYYVYGRIETRIKTKQKTIDLNETTKTPIYRP